MNPLKCMDVPAILDLIAMWRQQEWIRPLDEALAQFLWSEAQRTRQECPPALLLAAVLTSHQVGRGHVCLDLMAVLRAPDVVLAIPPDDEPLAVGSMLPSELLAGWTLAAWQQSLDQPWVVALSGDRPLILQGDLLYLRRYWDYEQQIIGGIERRLAQSPELNEQRLIGTLDKLFDSAPPRGSIDWQKVACALAARERFAVLTGGPGTGKTTTVVKLLATLQTQVLEAGHRPLSIRLAAPTGKAAARLNDSIRRQTDRFRDWFGADLGGRLIESVVAEKVSTVHRLLGTLPDGQGFRHHRWNRLDVDVVVVDEASMVDVQLMASLFAALPEQARLILLGDKDQLASVEAGAVLSQLCARAEMGGYWPSTSEWLERVTHIKLPAAFMASDPSDPSDPKAGPPPVSDRLPGFSEAPVSTGRQRFGSSDYHVAP
jgi:exodeoxyribonuclease V alpha subunit